MNILHWITQHLSKLFEGIFWHHLMERVQWVDWLTVAFVLLGMAYGSRKGLMRELVELLELVAVILLTYNYRGILLGFVKTLLPNFTDRTLAPVILIATALLFWGLIAMVDGFFKKQCTLK